MTRKTAKRRLGSDTKHRSVQRPSIKFGQCLPQITPPPGWLRYLRNRRARRLRRQRAYPRSWHAATSSAACDSGDSPGLFRMYFSIKLVLDRIFSFIVLSIIVVSCSCFRLRSRHRGGAELGGVGRGFGGTLYIFVFQFRSKAKHFRII